MIREYKYSSFDQDMVSNAGQDYELPQDYRYIRDKWWEKLLAPLLYALFALFARFYIHIVLHGRFVGKEKFLEVPRNKGFFIFGNHTQPVGDPFLAIAVGMGPRTRRRNRAVGSPANFGIPVLGKLFPMVGGIPTASSREGLMKMDHAISYYCSKAQPVVIYPEAHVWPYYTGIRPFAGASFHYPGKENLPSFTMTVTYQSRGEGKRPRATIFIDGPFFPDTSLPLKTRKKELESRLHSIMEQRAKASNCEWVKYSKTDENLTNS